MHWGYSRIRNVFRVQFFTSSHRYHSISVKVSFFNFIGDSGNFLAENILFSTPIYNKVRITQSRRGPFAEREYLGKPQKGYQKKVS